MLRCSKARPITPATTLPELTVEVAKALECIKRAEEKLKNAKQTDAQLTELYAQCVAEGMEF